MFKADCPACKGTGRCSCNGAGCSKCCKNQDGVTKVWHGNNKGDCPTCGGSGKVIVEEKK